MRRPDDGKGSHPFYVVKAAAAAASEEREAKQGGVLRRPVPEAEEAEGVGPSLSLSVWCAAVYKFSDTKSS